MADDEVGMNVGSYIMYSSVYSEFCADTNIHMNEQTNELNYVHMFNVW